MLSIKESNIKITQKDTASLLLKLNNYQFKEGDTVYFTVKNAYDSEQNRIQKVVTYFDADGDVITIGWEKHIEEPVTTMLDLEAAIAELYEMVATITEG